MRKLIKETLLIGSELSKVYELPTNEILKLAIQIQRNRILRDAFVLNKFEEGRLPALEEIAKSLNKKH